MSLAELRAQIDQIDEQIIKLVASRFEVTEEIGRIKATQNIAAVSPQREQQVFIRLRQIARDNELSEEMVADLFRLIIDEVVKNHRTLQAGKP